MKNLQEVFNRLQQTKAEMKKIKSLYREALEKSGTHKNTVEEMKTLREKKKKLEDAIKDQYSSELGKLENLKADIESDRMLLSDIALSKITRGEPIEVKDERDNSYEPLFSVTFKKK